jgi:hypothetical protein
MKAHPIVRVTACQVMGPRQLRVEFDDGTTQTIDFAPILRGELFGPLNDPGLFRQVKVDPEVHTLVWPNGADFDAATLHGWPQYLPTLVEQAKSWDLNHA